MADDARTMFVDGLRVTADHLQHLQDRLREAVLDLRRSIGLGRIAWGLRVELSGGSVRIAPGVAFAPSGVRLAIDTEAALTPPEGGGLFRVVLAASNEDRAVLRVGLQPTLVTLVTIPVIEVDDGAALGPDRLVIARLSPGDTGLVLRQDDALFAAT